MTKPTSKLFILIVVLVVILTAFLTWEYSEWQNKKIESQNVNAAAIYSMPNGNSGKIGINVIPPENVEIK